MANDSPDSPMKLIRKPKDGSPVHDSADEFMRELHEFVTGTGVTFHLAGRPHPAHSESLAVWTEQIRAMQTYRPDADVDVVTKLTSGHSAFFTARDMRQLHSLISLLLRKTHDATHNLQACMSDLTTENALLRSENAMLRGQVACASDEELTCTSRFGSHDIDEEGGDKENEPGKRGHRCRSPTFASVDFARCLNREELKRS